MPPFVVVNNDNGQDEITTKSERSDAKTTSKGKKPKKVKLKVEESEGVVVASKADEEVHKALVSINRINIELPPVPFILGTWNQRSVDAFKVRDLRESIVKHGLSRFDARTWFIAIARSDHLDPACINTNATLGSNAPVLALKLNAEGLPYCKNLVLAGGLHRLTAMEQNVKQAIKLIQDLESAINICNEDDAARIVFEAESGKTVFGLKEELKNANEARKDLQWWGLAIYEEGACFM